MHNSDDVNISFINNLVNDPIFIKKEFPDRSVFYFRNRLSGQRIIIKLIYLIENPADKFSGHGRRIS